METDWPNHPIGYLISCWMISSFAYYEMCESIITDSQFDDLCSELGSRIDEVRSSVHPHAHFVTPGRLASGSSDIRWPRITINSFFAMKRESRPGSICQGGSPNP